MQCSNGHDNPDGQRFCGECGEELAAIQPPPLSVEATDAADSDTETGTTATDDETAPSRRRWKWAVIAVAIAVVVMLIAALAGGGSNTSEKARRADGQTHSNVVGSHANSSPATPPTTAAPAHEVKIAGNGFTQLPPDSIGNSYVSYGVVVQNPSDDIAERVSLNVAFYNDAGVVVKADNPTIEVILPGQTAAYGDDVQAAGAARMAVQILVGTWGTATVTTGGFTAQGVTTVPQSYSGLKTNATLASTFAKDLKEVVAVAIYYDGNGAIVGGARTFVDFVPAGGQAAVEITTFHDLPAVARTDVFAELSSLSLLGT